MAEHFLISLIKLSRVVGGCLAENKIKLAKSIKIKRKKITENKYETDEYSQSLSQKLVRKLIWDVKNDHGHFYTLNMPTHALMHGWEHICMELTCKSTPDRMEFITHLCALLFPDGDAHRQQRGAQETSYSSRVLGPLRITKVTCVRISPAAFTGIQSTARNWHFIWLF